MCKVFCDWWKDTLGIHLFRGSVGCAKVLFSKAKIHDPHTNIDSDMSKILLNSVIS